MLWIVYVTDATATYAYGPFRRKEEAEKWAADHANQFFGRTIHVMPQRLIDPYAEA